MKELSKPTPELVRIYLKKFENDKRYSRADDAIIKLFAKFPQNNKIEDVILKVTVINSLYSTNIYSVVNLAEHILKQNIDADLKKGNLKLVSAIATGHGVKSSRSKENKELRFYSFATKYCNWHNKEKYPVYDSFVEKILIAYKNSKMFSEFGGFKYDDLKDYEIFTNIIDDFICSFKLKGFSLKQMDKFLWIYGKEMFSNK